MSICADYEEQITDYNECSRDPFPQAGVKCRSFSGCDDSNPLSSPTFVNDCDSIDNKIDCEKGCGGNQFYGRVACMWDDRIVEDITGVNNLTSCMDAGEWVLVEEDYMPMPPIWEPILCAFCGNGNLDTGEECDDGNTDVGDGCDANCIDEYCGDGVTNDVNEECDDGNAIDDDECSNTCQINDGAPIVEIYWADANGNFIDSSEVWDVVKMIVKETDLAEGTKVEFTIKELDIGGVITVDDIRVGEKAIIGEIINGAAIGIWQITQEDYELTRDYTDFVFFALGSESGRMFINGTDDSEWKGGDDPIILDILEPKCGENLTVDDVRNVRVEVNVSDVDDIVTGTVVIDGSVYNVTNGVSVFNHTFNKVGNIQIILTGNNTLGEEKQTITNIMVIDPDIDDVYVAACIDKPEDYEDIDGSVVLFEATSTRAIKCVSRVCKDIAGWDAGEGEGGDWSKLYFHWTFSDGRTHPSPEGSDPLSSLFYKTFTQVGDNWAELVVELNV